MYFTLTLEECVKYVAVAMFLPPRAQLPVPYTVHAIDHVRKFVSQQCIVILIAEMTSEFIFSRDSLNIIGGQHFRVQFWRAYALEIHKYHTRI